MKILLSVKIVLLVTVGTLAGCGEDEWNRIAEIAESDSDPQEDPTEGDDTPDAETSTEREVEVNVIIVTYMPAPKPKYLRKGLTMDQVADILGEPDEVYTAISQHWKYFEGHECCKVDDDCNIYFGKGNKLDYMTDIADSCKRGY